jgi:hypothetical protein
MGSSPGLWAGGWGQGLGDCWSLCGSFDVLELGSLASEYCIYVHWKAWVSVVEESRFWDTFPAISLHATDCSRHTTASATWSTPVIVTTPPRPRRVPRLPPPPPPAPSSSPGTLDVVCIVGATDSIVALHGSLEGNSTALEPPRVLLLAACSGALPGSHPASLHAIPGGSAPHSPLASVVFTCRGDPASGTSVVRELRVTPEDGTSVVTLAQDVPVTDVAVGDVNADGAWGDVVVAGTPGVLMVFSGVSSGMWALAATVSSGTTGGVVRVVELADLNNDDR